MTDDSLGPAQAADGLCRCGETTDTLIEEMIAAGVPARLVAKVAVMGERLRAADRALADERAALNRRRGENRDRVRRYRERKRADGNTAGVTVGGGIRHTSDDGIRHTFDEAVMPCNGTKHYNALQGNSAPQPAFDFIEQSPSRRAHTHARAHASTRNEESSSHKDSGIKNSEESYSTSNGKNRGTRLPSDWTPSEHDMAFATSRDMGLTLVETQQAADEFRDYWNALPGSRGRKMDWSATWRNRIREVVGRKRRTRASDSQREISDQVRAKLRAAANSVGHPPRPMFELLPLSAAAAIGQSGV